MIQRVIFWLLFIPVLAGIWYVSRLLINGGTEAYGLAFPITAMVVIFGGIWLYRRRETNY